MIMGSAMISLLERRYICYIWGRAGLLNKILEVLIHYESDAKGETFVFRNFNRRAGIGEYHGAENRVKGSE